MIRQKRRIMHRVLFFIFLVGACVSHSVWYERFQESRSLGSPPITLSLGNNEEFSFAMVGDLHVANADTDRLQQILSQAASEGDEFIILLGDLVDQGDRPSFEAVQSAIKSGGFEGKVVPLLGNHDIFSDGWDEFKNRWGASHYAVSLGNSRFIVLDTADGIIGADQMDWLNQELQTSTARHRFILTHYMPVVPGQRTYLRLSNQVEAERLMKVASRFGIKGVFGGHYHSYCQEKIAGVDYVVAGGGGGRRMEPVKNHFFVQVVVKQETITFNLRLLD